MVRYLQLQAKERAVVVVVAMREFICALVLGFRTIWLCVKVVLKWSFIGRGMAFWVGGGGCCGCC